MLWYSGTVDEAIGEVKARKAIFVVYIHGNDEQSSSMNNTFASPDVCRKLENDNYVAVKIESNSETCQQFSQIYPVILIPSTYFIGENGALLEIIGGYLTPEDFLAKINHVSQAGSLEMEQKVTEISEIQKPDDKPKVDSVYQKESQHRLLPEQHRVHEQVLKEDPVPQQQVTEAGEMKSETPSPKDTVILKSDECAEVSKKSKNDAFEGTKQQEPVKEPSRQDSNITRLQFRLPDGSSLTQQFSADDTLDCVRNYLLDNTNPRLSDFRLSTPFPRREYNAADYCQSLRELELTPCAVVLVMPIKRSIISSPSSGIASLVWILLGPLVTMFNYLRTSIFGSTDKRDDQQDRNKRTDVNTRYSERNESGTSYRTDRPSTAYKRKTDVKSSQSSSFTKKDGNIHRMVNQDDDEDNKTWNGNSTQQM